MADVELSKDQERLAKLWDAYEIQEKEYELSMKKIATLDRKIEELDRVNKVLKIAVEDRDKEIRDLELKVISLEEDNSNYKPQIDELNRLYKEEKERYAKLFAITEELEEELSRTRKEVEIKDKWFERNVGMLENIRDSIIDKNVKLNELERGLPARDRTPLLKPASPLSPDAPSTGATTSTSTNISLSDSGNTTGASTDSSTNLLEEKSPNDSSVTFKKVVVASESTPNDEPSTSESTTEPTENPVTKEPSRSETLKEFLNLPNVKPTIAENLYNGGFTSMDKLKVATTEQLANIEGISPTLARKIRTDLFDLK